LWANKAPRPIEERGQSEVWMIEASSLWYGQDNSAKGRFKLVALITLAGKVTTRYRSLHVAVDVDKEGDQIDRTKPLLP